MSREDEIIKLVASKFSTTGVLYENVKVRAFPGEYIVVVNVAGDLGPAIQIANELDGMIDDGFVTVRQVPAKKNLYHRRVESIRDDRVTRLIETLDSRSRTSEAQPSLRYIPDIEGRLSVALARRHHLIFGRRGVGKTALMLEAKKLAEERGERCVWLNVQSVRDLGAFRAFLTLAGRICDLPRLAFGSEFQSRRSGQLAAALSGELVSHLDRPKLSPGRVRAMIPRIQQMLSALCAECGADVYIFLDDVHYLSPGESPEFLDLVHAATRDTPTWLKVAGIRHQMKWFSAEERKGLQVGHDASEVNLDITLEEPERAKRFLNEILDGYVDESNAGPRRGFLSDAAIDRLVLASGGVPRDFTILCAEAIQGARRRTKARVAGVQDVNQAAGAVVASKIRELEDDAASDVLRAKRILDALTVVRDFLLTRNQITFLRIDFLDKERRANEYSLIQSLMDLRMLHLLNASISDAHHAGNRSEVYLLDLSQYSGARLKQNLRVLDFQDSHLVLKRTRASEQIQVGDTARRLTTILRRGPQLQLELLESGESVDRASL